MISPASSFNALAINDSAEFYLVYAWFFLFWFGGDKRTRTADILLAKQALYQLSYTPMISMFSYQLTIVFIVRCLLLTVHCFVVGHPGLEPGTSPLSGVRSNHLS